MAEISEDAIKELVMVRTMGSREAAQIDGAGEWQIYRRICMPLCKGALYSAAILVFIDYWNMVEQPLILLSDPQTHPLSVAVMVPDCTYTVATSGRE